MTAQEATEETDLACDSVVIPAKAGIQGICQGSWTPAYAGVTPENLRGGFTLLEVLVATVIGAFVAATAVSTLRVISSGRGRIEDNLEMAAELRFAEHMISSDLANVYRDPDQGKVIFIGDALSTDTGQFSRLLLHAVNRTKARGDEPEADVYEVEYYVRVKDARSVLMRRVFPNPYESDEPHGVVTEIAEGIVAFDVVYFDGQEWAADWPEEMSRLPQLVDVRLEAGRPGRKQTVKGSFLAGFGRWPRAQRNAGAAQAPR